MSIEPKRGILRLEIESDDLEPGKIPVRDLTRLAGYIQTGIERMARRLSGLPGAAAGPEPRSIRDATRLLLVALEAGSAKLVLEVPEPTAEDEAHEEQLFEPPPRDLGFRAMQRFVEGIHELETASAPVMPADWDASLLQVAQDLAKLSEERRYDITFDALPPGGERRVAHITPAAANRFTIQPAPTRRLRTALGRLILVDLGRGRIDIEDSAGHRTHAVFEEGLQNTVRRLVGEFVRASGEEEVDEATGRRENLEVAVLDAVGEQALLGAEFWSDRSADEQATEQGVGPISSIDDFSAPDVFSEKDLDDFLQAIRESRSDG